MNYSEDILNQIQEFASAFTPISDIALLLDLDCDTLRADIKDYQSKVSIAYRKGKAQSLYTLRRNEIDLAEAGSPQASIAVQRYCSLMEDDEAL